MGGNSLERSNSSSASATKLGRRHPLVWLRWGSLIVPLLVLVVAAVPAYRQERDRTEQLALQHAELIAQYALRVVETQSAVLDRLSDLAAIAADGVSGNVLQERLATLEAETAYVLSLGVVSWEGTIVAASRPAIVGMDASDRDYFRALEADPSLLYVDRVRLLSDETDAIVIARTVDVPGFAGIAVSTIKVEAMTNFFARVAAPGETPGLLREDGKVLVRSRAELPTLVLTPEAPAMRAIAQARAGVFETTALSDGVRRIYAHTRVEGLPIASIYGIEVAEIWRRWRARLWIGGLALGAIGLSGFVVSGQAIRRIAAEDAARRAAFDRSLYEEARRAAAFRETLLREMHHRIKNNLHQVLALLRSGLRGGGTIDPKELEGRIWAIAEVHDLLHVSGTVARLDLADLVRAIASNPAIVPPERGIAVSCDAEPVEIGIDEGTPLALVLVEIVTNAVKHAFPTGDPGTIRVNLRREGASALLEIADDGIGLPASHERTRNSGLRLIDGLVRQIGGTMTVEARGGTRYAIRVPLAEARGV